MTARLPLFLAGALLLLAGCTGGRNAKRTPPPEWVSQRPISRMHYIGIGSAVNTPIPGEALRIAKERAAADLIGEIAVRIESASLLESEDRNGRVREDFNSTISSRSNERIAGFEVLGVYEGSEATHVYYRLDKQRHAAARAARKQTATEVALSEWASGQSDLDAGRVPNALEHWATGILALEEFWNDVNRADIEGENVALEPHFIRAMREAIRNLDIRPSVDRVLLSARGGFQFPLGLHATLDGQSASGIPIAYHYHNGTYRKRATEFTDEEGLVVALIERVEATRPDRDIVCTVDAERLMDAAHLNPIVVELLGRHSVRKSGSNWTSKCRPSALFQPQFRPVRVKSHALGGCHALGPSGCRLQLGTGGHGERLPHRIQPALGTPHPVRHLWAIPPAYIEGTMTLSNRQGEVVEEIQLERVKGVQLDAEAALQLALSNAAEAVRKNHGRTQLRGME